MPVERIQPPDLFDSQRLGFTQVVTSPPGRLVFVSGQVAWDENLNVVGGGDFSLQAERAFENLHRALKAAGASPSDVTSLRFYVVNYEPRHGIALAPILRRFLGDSPPPAQTLLGVQSLVTPDLLIELEAMAVVG